MRSVTSCCGFIAAVNPIKRVPVLLLDDGTEARPHAVGVNHVDFHAEEVFQITDQRRMVEQRAAGVELIGRLEDVFAPEDLS